MSGLAAYPGWGDPISVDVVSHGPEHAPDAITAIRASIASLLGQKWRGVGGSTFACRDHRLDLGDRSGQTMLTLRMEHDRIGEVWAVETPRPEGLHPHDPETCLRHALAMIDACAAATPRDAVRAWIMAIASMLAEDGIEVRTVRFDGPYGGFRITERILDSDGRPRLRSCGHPLVHRFSKTAPSGMAMNSYAAGEGSDCARIIITQEGGVVAPGSANHPQTDLLETMRAIAFVTPFLEDPS